MAIPAMHPWPELHVPANNLPGVLPALAAAGLMEALVGEHAVVGLAYGGLAAGVVGSKRTPPAIHGAATVRLGLAHRDAVVRQIPLNIHPPVAGAGHWLPGLLLLDALEDLVKHVSHDRTPNGIRSIPVMRCGRASRLGPAGRASPFLAVVP